MLTCYAHAIMGNQDKPLSRQTSHTFIVRIWREQREVPSAPDEWRGVVEHVSSGQRWYVLRAKQVAQVLALYWGQPTSHPWWVRAKLRVQSFLCRPLN